MKWNLDRLIECYYGGEADDLFSKGGIADPRNAESAMVRSDPRWPNKALNPLLNHSY